MMKHVAKRILRAGGKLLPRGGRRVVVICYHSVHPSNSFSSATPELFGDHLAWLAEHCEVVPFSEVRPAPQSAGGRPIVAITFDDGHEDNHRYAFPRLKEHDLSATFFLTAGLLENDPDVVARFQRIRRSDYEAIRPLEWTQVREMLDEGMDVGAHSYSHRNFVRLDRNELRHELVDAKRIVEERAGRPVTAFAYPFGKPRIHFTPAAEQVVREAGYALAAATIKRGVRPTDPPLRLPRMFVTHDSVPELREKVLGYWDAIGVLQERSPVWLSRLVSPIDFIY